MRLAKALLSLACIQAFAVAAFGQKLDHDPNRIFTTALKWERIKGSPRSDKVRAADGKLVILYLEGVYAEVTASFIKTNDKLPLSLNLKEEYVVRLGSWSRTDDDRLIRIESRDAVREKLQGLTTHQTCRLEGPSPVYIADTIVCSDGSTVSHLQKQINLADFPAIVSRLVAEQAKKD